MYQRPFGSIFGKAFSDATISHRGNKTTLGFLDQAPSQANNSSATPTASTQIDQTPSDTSIQDQAPPDVNTQPFQNVTDGFRAETELKVTDPNLQLANMSHEVLKNKQQFDIKLDSLNKIKDKIQKAQKYLALLNSFALLSTDNQNGIIKWLNDNEQAINNLAKVRELKKLTEKISIKNAQLDAEILHKKNLLDLKNQDVDIQDAEIQLQSYRPIAPKIKLDVNKTGPLPQLGAKVPMDQIYTLVNKNLGDSDFDNATYFQQFKQTLANPQFYRDQQDAARQPADLNRKIQNALFENKQIEWKSKDLDKQVASLKEQYNKIQGDIQLQLDQLHQMNQKSIKITTLIAILAERGSVNTNNILESFKKILKSPTQLGNSQDNQAATDTNQLVQQASTETQAALAEQTTKEVVLNRLQSAIDGKEIQSSTPPTQIESKINWTNLLPWVIGFLIFVIIVR